jgi:hypothetical protein
MEAIISLSIIALALVWLGYETKYFTIRLESYEYQKDQTLQSKSSGIETSASVILPTPPDTTEPATPYKPSDFTPLDMPELTGNLNIICKRC